LIEGRVIMYAVIQTGGKQYRVTPGEEITVERFEGDIGDTIYFDEVLLVSKDDTVSVGKPVLKDTRVAARITRHSRGPKIVVFKYKRRKGYRRKQGHRQDYTGIKILDIET
jgi:large subunit ribosomal protein L21